MNAKELQEARAAAEEAARRVAERERKGDEDVEDDEDAVTVHDSQDEISADEDISKAARAEEENKVIDQDPRTRILNVLELEGLFISSAPNPDRESQLLGASFLVDLRHRLLLGFTPPGGQTPKLNVGLVGYPNVGKSSTINALIGEKKVSVSSTPGKTKHFQTIHLSPSIMLCDCPGLVFPQFATTKAELVCDGVLPIDQMREYTAPVELVVRRIATPILEATYGLAIPRELADEGGNGNIHAEDLLKIYASEHRLLRSGS